MVSKDGQMDRRQERKTDRKDQNNIPSTFIGGQFMVLYIPLVMALDLILYCFASMQSLCLANEEIM